MFMMRKIGFILLTATFGLVAAGCVHVQSKTHDPSKVVRVRAPFTKVDVDLARDDDDVYTDVHVDVDVDD
jgi:hypothetical protein